MKRIEILLATDHVYTNPSQNSEQEHVTLVCQLYKKNNPDEDTQEMLSIPVKVVKLISHNIYLDNLILLLKCEYTFLCTEPFLGFQHVSEIRITALLGNVEKKKEITALGTLMHAKPTHPSFMHEEKYKFGNPTATENLYIHDHDAEITMLTNGRC